MLSCEEYNKVKTSESRIIFRSKNNYIIMLHRPHPDPHLKHYVIKYLVDELKK